MGAEFVDRREWRGRGRPRTQPDPAVVAMLRRCADNPNVMVRLTLDEGTDVDEVRKTVTQLRAAARSLGLALRIQPRRARDIQAAGAVAFYVEQEEG